MEVVIIVLTVTVIIAVEECFRLVNSSVQKSPIARTCRMVILQKCINEVLTY